MKYTVVAASLLALAAAQPHHGHKHAHKRDNVVIETDYVTATAPDVVVYVDQYGNPIKGPAQATNAPAYAPAPAPAAQPTYVPAAAPAPAPVSAPVAPSPKQSSAPVAAPAPAPAYSGNNGSATAPSNTGSGSALGGLGITYSPYNSDGTCKTASQVSADLDQLTQYKAIRIYNSDCDQINTVGTAAAKHGMTLYAGIFDISDVHSATQALISGFKSNWAGVSTVSVGNELVNSGKASIDQVIAAITIARPLLRAAGFNGDVVTTDTNNVVLNLDGQHPRGIELCKASDHCSFNAHPFFAPVAAEKSGDWAKDQVAQAKKLLGDDSKKVVIAESGWPSNGQANGVAVPSLENQKTAIAQISGAFNNDMFLFTAFNDAWKAPGAFNCEQYWGVHGNSAQ